MVVLVVVRLLFVFVLDIRLFDFVILLFIVGRFELVVLLGLALRLFVLGLVRLVVRRSTKTPLFFCGFWFSMFAMIADTFDYCRAVFITSCHFYTPFSVASLKSGSSL